MIKVKQAEHYYVCGSCYKSKKQDNVDVYMIYIV